MKKNSSYQIDRIIKQILNHVDTKIRQIQFIKANMNVYSCSRMINMVNQLGDQLLTSPNQLQTIPYEGQPKKIGVDTLMSVNNLQEVEECLQRQENTITVTSQRKSNRRQYKKNECNRKNNINTEKLVLQQKKRSTQNINIKKLKLQQNIDDQEIQKIRQQKQKILQQQKQIITFINTSVKILKNIKHQINFDYSGNIIQVKTQKRNNFISKLVVPKIPTIPTEQPLKKQFSKTKVTFVQTNKIIQQQQKDKNKKQSKSKSKLKQKQYKVVSQKLDIVFSKIKNPIENIEVKEGVKATFNQSVLQKKKQKLNSEELNLPNSKKQISRQQYGQLKTVTLRIKTIEQSQPNIETIEPVVNLQKQINKTDKNIDRINSSKRRSVTQSGAYKVHVGNLNLKKQLVQKQKQQKNPIKKVLDDRSTSQPKKKQELNKIDKQELNKIDKQELNKIDKYNLNYSRNKTQYSALNKISDQDNMLPKISLKNKTNFPKIRQKVKQTSAIRRQATRKFQQILRV